VTQEEPRLNKKKKRRQGKSSVGTFLLPSLFESDNEEEDNNVLSESPKCNQYQRTLKNKVFL
jgi:hypothetical protein